jgi:hypothetical protein
MSFFFFKKFILSFFMYLHVYTLFGQPPTLQPPHTSWQNLPTFLFFDVFEEKNTKHNKKNMTLLFV